MPTSINKRRDFRLRPEADPGAARKHRALARLDRVTSKPNRVANPGATLAQPRELVQTKPEVKVVRAYYHIQRHETQWRLRCRAISGRTVRFMVRLADIEKLSDFRKLMADAGVSLAGNPARVLRVHEEVMRQARDAAKDRKREMRLTSELGWHEDGTFVFPGRTYPKATRLRFEPADKRAYAGAKRAGTFKGWKTEVAGPAACSSRIIFAIGAALVPPLLKPGGRLAGGVAFAIAGDSRTGKSTAVALAKSVLDEPMLDTWGLTRAGGTGALLGHTDLPVFLDETRAVRGGERRGGTIVSELTRLLSGGRPDLLDPGWTAEHRKAVADAVIRTVLLATTEGQLDPARLAGERARMISVPAGRPKSFGVVDYPERAEPPIEDAAGAGALLEQLLQSAAQHHGHAFPRFVKWLIENGDALPKLIQHHRDVFYAAAGGATLDGWARSVLDWFCLAYVALRLARRAKVLPWPWAVVRDGVLRCWQDAMQQEGQAANTPDTVAERLRSWLREAPRRAKVDKNFDPQRLDTHDVLLDRHKDTPVVLVQRKRLVDVAGGEAMLDAALELMRERGEVLAGGKSGGYARQKRLPNTEAKFRFVFFRKSVLDNATKG